MLQASASAGIVTFPPRNNLGAAFATVDDKVKAYAAELQPLVAAAKPAVFGRGTETVPDPSYRTALELPVADFGLNVQLPTPDMLADIKQLLKPNASTIIADL